MAPPIVLPSEILREIFSYLKLPDTANVSRVSRQWRTWSEEQLYTEIQFIHPISSPALLLRTLLTPGLERLGHYVRTLMVEWDYEQPENIEEGDTMATPGRAAATMALYQTARSVDEQIWLLLHLLPHLDTLGLEFFTFRRIRVFIGRMHEHEDLPRGLRCVRRVLFQGNASAELCLALSRLPCIRTLQVWGYQGTVVPFPTCYHQTSGVTDLLFSVSRINVLSLRHVLQIPRALTCLKLSGSFRLHAAESARMQAALEPLRMTLQQLYLRISTDEDSPAIAFLTLRTWPVLRRLWCPLNCLLGGWTEAADLHLENVLPLSLRELSVYADVNWTHEQRTEELVRLVKRKEEALPLLEKVCMESEMEGEGEL